MTPPPPGFSAESMGGDRIRLLARAGGRRRPAGRARRPVLDRGECVSFTGRVLGLYATEGTVSFADLRYRGTDAVPT